MTTVMIIILSSAVDSGLKALPGTIHFFEFENHHLFTWFVILQDANPGFSHACVPCKQ